MGAAPAEGDLSALAPQWLLSKSGRYSRFIATVAVGVGVAVAVLVGVGVGVAVGVPVGVGVGVFVGVAVGVGVGGGFSVADISAQASLLFLGRVLVALSACRCAGCLRVDEREAIL